ncbi:type II toxin-antitoxin system antitoxin [Rheinheimera gaetbuli]
MAKKAFALRLDEKMLSALQHWADDEFRSINGQIEYLLHEALKKAGRLPVTKKANAESDNEAGS